MMEEKWSLSVTDFQDYQVIQRKIGGTSAEISVGGTYSGQQPASIKARVLKQLTDEVVVNWTAIDTAPEEGKFAGKITVPQGGWYKVETQSLDNQEKVICSARGNTKWGVGIIILAVGQSNMVGQGKPPYTLANDLVANYTLSGSWQHLKDPYGGEGASMVPALGNSLTEALGIPVGFVPAADSGSGLSAPNIGHEANRYWLYRNENNPADTTNIFGMSIARAKTAGGVELIVWNQGETDGRLLISEEAYEANMKELLRRFRDDLGEESLPMFICQIGTHDTNISNDAAYTEIRNAQHDLDDGKNFFLAATEMEFARMDTAHYTTEALNEIGERVANTIKYYYGLSSYYRGPSIADAKMSAPKNIIEVTVAHRGGTDITTNGEITGFEVLVNGKNVEINSAERLNSKTIRITLTEHVKGTDKVTMRYLYGLNPPHSNIVKDNTELRLPMESTTKDMVVTKQNGKSIPVNPHYDE